MEARTTLKQPVFCHRTIPKPLSCSRRRTGSVRRDRARRDHEEGQEHQERQPVLLLLDGRLARGERIRNVHLGSCAKMDAEASLQKARAMKAEAQGIKL